MSLLPLSCGLGLALVAASALAWVLARGLGLPLPWRVQALGLCLPLAILLPLLAGGRLLAPTDAPILANLPDAPRVAAPDEAHGVFNDAILQLLPWEAEVRRGFAEGRLPLWSDLLDGGSSPWVNPQAGVLSPIAILGRLVPLEHFLLAALAVKILLAFDGCWLLARQLGASRFAAALGAGAFALGGPVVAWAVFPLSSVVAWSPWLALAAIRVVRRPAPRRIAAAALVLAALLLSGHPEVALAASVVAAGCAAIAWRRRPGVREPGGQGPGGRGPGERTEEVPGWLQSRRRGRSFAPAAAALAAVALGAGLAACQLVPFLLVAPRSLRAVQSAALAAAEVAATPSPAFRWFPGGGERLFLSPLNPWAFGRPFHDAFTGPARWPIAAGGYLGLVALAGIAAALVSPRRRLAACLAALALLLFLAAARFYPVWRLVTSLPLGGALAVDRFLPAAALPLAMLAALGIDHLRRGSGLSVWAAALASAAASLWLRHDPPLLALWGLVGLGIALGRLGGSRRRRLLGPGLLAAATLLDLGAWDRDALPRGHRELFYPRTPLIDAIVTGAAGAAGGPWRAVAGGFSLYPSLLPMYGVADVRVDNPLAPADQVRPLSEIFGFQPEGRRYKSAFRHLDHRLLDFLNVRVVVLADAALAGRRPLELLRGDPPLRVYRNPSALPRWFLATGAEPCRPADALRALRELRDPRRVVLDAGQVGGWRPPERPWDPAAVRVMRARPGAVSLALPPAGEKLLATSLPFPAGWTARAGARRLRTVTVDTAYLGVVAPAGVAGIDLTFAPPGLGLGAALSSLALLGVAFLVAWPGARRAERGRSRPRHGHGVEP